MQITDKVMANVLSDMVIIVDTREQKNRHILDYFDSKDIKYKEEKLLSADYTVDFPNFKELGLDRLILIERKNSLNEIAGNFTKNRVRFVEEFERINGQNIHLLIEGSTWGRVIRGTYRSKLPPQSMLASLMTWHVRYNCPIWFCQQNESGMLIYNLIKYTTMEKLKDMRKKN